MCPYSGYRQFFAYVPILYIHIINTLTSRTTDNYKGHNWGKCKRDWSRSGLANLWHAAFSAVSICL